MARRLPRWDRLSLRSQLTLVNVALLAVCLIIAGIGTTLLLRPTLIGHVDASLRSIAADPSLVIPVDNAGRFTYEGVRSAPQPYYVALVREDGQLLVDNWSGRPEQVAPQVNGLAMSSDLGPGSHVFEVHDSLGSPWRAVAVTASGYPGSAVSGTLVVAYPLSTVNATMASFLAIFLGFGLSVLVFGAALTRLLVSATLQPLRQVESTAMAFAAGDYDRRLPESTSNTEVGRLSRSLNTMLGQIDSALDERDVTIDKMRRFVGDASHELRTPLVTVRGYAELYRMGALDDEEKVSTAMDRIEGEAKRMAGLVEDLLQLARLDERREIPMDVIDLEPIAEDAAMDTVAQAPDRVVRALPMRVILPDDAALDPDRSAFDELEPGAGDESSAADGDTEVAERSGATAAQPQRSPARRSSRLARLGGLTRRNRGAATEPSEAAPDASETERAFEAEDFPAMISGNGDKVRQAVQNIIGNALRYTPEGSPMELGVVVDAQRELAIIEIIDHGPGIPAEIRSRIFQRFWRADTSRTRETGGSGLGLAIVSAIMEAHGGSVDVVETRGGGATFRLKFPLLTASPVDEDGFQGSEAVTAAS